MDPRLEEWVSWLRATDWSLIVLDRDDTVVWVSDEFKVFLGEEDDDRVGVGRHMIEAFSSPLWLGTITPESALELLNRGMPYFLSDDPAANEALAGRLEEPVSSAIRSLSPQTPPDLWTGRYEYVPAPGLPPNAVDYLVTRLRDAHGKVVGSCIVNMLAMRPALLSLLSRGDAHMYERMARLVTPGRQQTAILFADLQGSGDISRRLPTVRYFELVSQLTARFDAAVAASGGIVGKHAGDGWTAFYLVADAGSPERAAAGALRTARALQQAATSMLQDGSRGLPQLCVNVGVHWGPNLYIGQLVPGGRLDVTALGDEVNECARLQETARDGAILASKTLVELLGPATCRELSIEADSLAYQPLGSYAAAGEKALRDAAALAVCRL